MATHINWYQTSVEVVLIVIGLLLALWLNGWYEDRANQRVAMIALQGVVDEHSENCAIVNLHSQYHADVVDKKVAPEGIRIGLLRNTAWDSAKTAGAAVNLDYEMAELIGRIQAQQSDHRELVRSYMQALFSRILVTDTIATIHGRGEIAVINELLRIQRSLAPMYLEFKERAEARYKNAISIDSYCALPASN